jgi:peptide/nickel transport system substrate-binding protein
MVERDRRALLKGVAVAGAAGITGVGLQPAGRAAAQAATPTQGGEFVAMGHQEVASLSPDDDDPSVHYVVTMQLFNPLVEIDLNYEPKPVLATAMPDISEDGLTYTFTLHEGVLFHDGTELTSADVKYTYEWYMNPDNAAINANDFALVESVEAPDPYTVIVRMTQPNAAFFSQVGETFIVPAAYHAEIGEEAFKSAPIGTGAFKLREWRAAEFTVLDAFDDHFRGRPHLDSFRLNVVPEPSVRAIALETGDADSSIWPLVTEDELRLSETGQFTTFVTSSLALNHFPLNNEHPALSDKRVRQAFMHAIDRQAVIDDIFSGAATLATANLSPAMGDYYTADVAEYPYDPERAAALLDEAGWVLGDSGMREKDGEPLSFVITVITGDQARRPEAEVVQSYLLELGVDVQIEEAPVATILEQMPAGELDASLFNWTYGGDGGDPDASNVLASDAVNNFSQFRNERVDELLVQGLAETDIVARAAIYHEIQQIFAEEVPVLYMMFWDLFNHFNTRIKGLPESAQYSDMIYATAHQWWIEEGS